jgi:hypothetical protein
MSWIWEKSPAWRWIVRGTRGNPVAMTAFSVTTMLIIPIGLGTVIMNGAGGGLPPLIAFPFHSFSSWLTPTSPPQTVLK